jgi:hypothetical protein
MHKVAYKSISRPPYLRNLSIMAVVFDVKPSINNLSLMLKVGSLRGAKPLLANLYSLSRGWKGGQASNEDLFPLGYGERDRVRVRVKLKLNQTK